MRRAILGIIVLCLMPAASVVTAQDIDEQELQRRLLDDIGVTEAELMQFGVNLAGVLEPYQQYGQEYQDRLDTSIIENYVEVVEDVFDHFIQPLIGEIRMEAINFFTEDQYAKMTTLVYQIAENFPRAFQDDGNDMSGLYQLFVLPDVVSLTEKQLVELAAMQKEVMTELVGIEIITKGENPELFAEQDALFKEMEKTENEEEKAVIREKWKNITKQTSTLMRERIQKTYDKHKAKLDTLLTAEQIAKLAQIKQDIPDYLKDALAKMTQTRTDDNAETPAAWRPGINSWVPGQGAPKDLENYPREVPRVREPRGERRFPGSE